MLSYSFQHSLIIEYILGNMKQVLNKGIKSAYTKGPSDAFYSKAFLWNLAYLVPLGEEFMSLLKGKTLWILAMRSRMYVKKFFSVCN